MNSSRDLLEAEAKNFFANKREEEEEETRAFQSVSLHSLARNEEGHKNHGT
jgi:hypothetical protein